MCEQIMCLRFQSEKRPNPIELDPGDVRQRQDEQERQLVAVRQIHGHTLRLQGRPHGRTHQQLPVGEEPRGLPSARREELPLFLSGKTKAFYKTHVRTLDISGRWSNQQKVVC